MSTTLSITAEEFSRMSFDVPVELIRGEVVERANFGGRHGTICFNTAGALFIWLQSGQPYRVAMNDSGVILARNPDTVRGSDLLVVQNDKLPNGVVPTGYFEVPPDVTIEVVSPSDRWSDLLKKVSQFLRAGVGEVWIINPDHRRVHQYRNDDEPSVLNDDQKLTSALLPGFECPVSDLFRGL